MVDAGNGNRLDRTAIASQSWDTYRRECWDWHYRGVRQGPGTPVQGGWFLKQCESATLSRLILEAKYDKANGLLPDEWISVEDAKAKKALSDNMIQANKIRRAKEVPLILETHDVQANQYALRDARPVFRKKSDPLHALLQTKLSYCWHADLLIHITSEDMQFLSGRLRDKKHVLLYPFVDCPVQVGSSASCFFDRGWQQLCKFCQCEMVSRRDTSICRRCKNQHCRRDICPNLRRERHNNLMDIMSCLLEQLEIWQSTMRGLGYGLSIKTVDAMLSDLQLIATPRAFRGIDIDLASLSNVRIATSAMDFAAHMQQLLKRDNVPMSRSTVAMTAETPELCGADPFPGRKLTARTSSGEIARQLFSFHSYLPRLSNAVDELLRVAELDGKINEFGDCADPLPAPHSRIGRAPLIFAANSKGNSDFPERAKVYETK
jgi:hypothetical protein